MNTYTVIVPEYFARDHWARGCMIKRNDSRWESMVIKRSNNKVTLELDETEIREMHDDADYYATSGSYKEPEWFGLRSSARAVRNGLVKQCPQVFSKTTTEGKQQ